MGFRSLHQLNVIPTQRIERSTAGRLPPKTASLSMNVVVRCLKWKGDWWSLFCGEFMTDHVVKLDIYDILGHELDPIS